MAETPLASRGVPWGRPSTAFSLWRFAGWFWVTVAAAARSPRAWPIACRRWRSGDDGRVGKSAVMGQFPDYVEVEWATFARTMARSMGGSIGLLRTIRSGTADGYARCS